MNGRQWAWPVLKDGDTSPHYRAKAQALEDLGRKAQVVRYATSDRRLRWNETRDDYMGGPRATAIEVAQYWASLAQKGIGRDLGEYPALAGIVPLLSSGERKLAASLDGEELAAARILRGAIRALIKRADEDQEPWRARKTHSLWGSTREIALLLDQQ